MQDFTPNVSFFYGAADIAARYCGLKDTPTWLRGYWHHGWAPKFFQVDPVLVTNISGPSAKKSYYWVSRQDEADYLAKAGYEHVQAIGLPFVYLPERVTVRQPGSLLVMPAHSLDTSKSSWSVNEYAEEISRIRHHFSRIVVCVHPACWRNGIWVNAFRDRGFEVVQALEPGFVEGMNSLERLQTLFQMFEFMTTNAFGSHIVYAASLGTRVSIWGPYAERKVSDYTNEPFFQFNPHLTAPAVQLVSEEVIRRHYPKLFCQPDEAELRIDWGRHEIGYDCKVLPSRLRGLFQWRLHQRTAQRFRSSLPERIKHWGRLLLRAEYRCQHQELRRLRNVPRFVSTQTNLLGKPFNIVDAESFRALYRDIIQNEDYRFITHNRAPVIIDGGANIGVSIVYFKKLFPEARIIAFEPDPDLFKVLSENCSRFGFQNTELICKALWSSETILEFRQEGTEAGRILTSPGFGKVIKVPTCRLRDYLTREIDLLKLDIEGAETEVLRDCADRLACVQRVLVEYHSFLGSPQSLEEVTAILKQAGFRLYLKTLSRTTHPFVERHVVEGMDFQTNIYAYRL